MIQRQFYRTREDGVILYITFSDEGMMIEKKSTSKRKELYRTAIDVESANFEYVETDKAIEYTKEEKKLMAEHGIKYWVPALIKIEIDETL